MVSGWEVRGAPVFLGWVPQKKGEDSDLILEWWSWWGLWVAHMEMSCRQGDRQVYSSEEQSGLGRGILDWNGN